jgi:phosphatidylglycerol---prolipoprotein diacylglyceryl transferase
VLPYVTVPALHLGPVVVHPFGVLVGAGCLLGSRLVWRRGRSARLDPAATRALIVWVLVCGFIGAHVFDVLAFRREQLFDRPWVLLELWNGIWSYGGFIGALIGFGVCCWRRGLPGLPYADALAMGLAPGWALGRAGCALMHDHVGGATQFFLAVRYPDGHNPSGIHHNLGLYECLFALAITGVLYVLARKPRTPGVLVAAMVLGYAPVRFVLEILRGAADGFTLNQCLCAVSFIVAVCLIARARLFARVDLPAPGHESGQTEGRRLGRTHEGQMCLYAPS